MPLITPAEPHILYEPSLCDAVERIEEWVRPGVSMRRLLLLAVGRWVARWAVLAVASYLEHRRPQ